MLRTLSTRLGHILARNLGTKTMVKTIEPAKSYSPSSWTVPLITSQQSRKSSTSISGKPTLEWKMPPPSLIDLLVPVRQTPVAPKIAPLDLPVVPKTSPGEDRDEIQAARLIVIRRHKMKKHKRKKLRKRMKFEWAKLRMRREAKKEKDFQQGLISQVEEAHSFNAEAYVQEKLKKLKMSGKL
ncbi:uncharacterized protein LOC132204673 [Neocloeon triangulifer]|uniref:uncharacterized protein LOC132204673 n=1 Tax=Neocloeon triangulifer TaxID=2078957 RepID=UPI00286F55CE|nr:uncharacterized protein LOC132204673 [Neocloeon triangulifer]